MKAPRYLEAEFVSLMNAIYPESERPMKPHVREELRRIFMAGALSFKFIIETKTSRSDEVEPGDLALMSALELELEVFATSFRKPQ